METPHNTASGAQDSEAHHSPSSTGNNSTSTSAPIPLEALKAFVQETLPPISMDRFIETSGLSQPTIWRYRRQGMIKTSLIAGRHYLTPAQVAEFNARLSAGEFAGNGPRTPSRTKIAA
jgi:hypothetical protein